MRNLTVTGSRFLSPEKEQELRANILRRDSETSRVEEVMMDGLEETDEGAGLVGPEEGRRAGGGQREPNRNRTIGEQRNEFDVGAKMTEVSERIRGGVRSTDLEGVMKATREGLIAMVEGLESAMNGISDGIRNDRTARQEEARRDELRMVVIEEKVRENQEEIEGQRQDRDRTARKESTQILIEKLRQADRQLKYLDVDFGRATNSRREIVEKAISYMKEDVSLSERKRPDTVLKRTRFVILGRETKLREIEEQRMYTVPIMLEFRTGDDKVEVEEKLKAVGWFLVYHWPIECLEFIKEARAEVRSMGFSENSHHVKIRPEWRQGRMELRQRSRKAGLEESAGQLRSGTFPLKTGTCGKGTRQSLGRPLWDRGGDELKDGA